MILGMICIGFSAIFLMIGLIILKESNRYERKKRISIPTTYENSVVKFDHKSLDRMSKM
jgi:uncharacterized membrane protein YozB (DUF420 family)